MAAVLQPQPALLDVDAASTQQLQIAAAWTEVDDNIETEMSQVAVQNVPISRGDEALQEDVVQQFGGHATPNGHLLVRGHQPLSTFLQG